IHGLFQIFLNPNVHEQIILPFLQKFDELFTCVHAHPNNCCGIMTVPETNINVPDVIELTFIRKDRISKTSERLRFPDIPHPLDIGRNVPEKPPIFLNEFWGHGPIAPVSKMKILEDQVSYLYDVISSSEIRLTQIIEKAVSLAIRSSNKQQAEDNRQAEEDDSDLEEVAAGCRFFLSSAYPGYEQTGIVPDKVINFFFTT